MNKLEAFQHLFNEMIKYIKKHKKDNKQIDEYLSKLDNLSIELIMLNFKEYISPCIKKIEDLSEDKQELMKLSLVSEYTKDINISKSQRDHIYKFIQLMNNCCL